MTVVMVDHSCFGTRSLSEDMLTSAEESDKGGDGGEIGESVVFCLMRSMEKCEFRGRLVTAINSTCLFVPV